MSTSDFKIDFVLGLAGSGFVGQLVFPLVKRMERGIARYATRFMALGQP